MSVKAWLRWVVFACYAALFFAGPLALLWGRSGLALGLTLNILFLFYIGWRGNRRIGERLNVVPLTRAESPVLYTLCAEYSRRLEIPMPRLGVIDTPAINSVLFGFSRKNYHLVLTKGALNSLDRKQLGAVIARQLVCLREGDAFGNSWLSQFLAILDRLSNPLRGRPSNHHARRFYSFRLVFRQAILYPLALFPTFVLRVSRDPMELDLKSARVTRSPFVLAETLRILDAFQDRIPILIPLNVRHLFLLPPPSRDPLARVLFEHSELVPRIAELEKLRVIVGTP